MSLHWLCKIDFGRFGEALVYTQSKSRGLLTSVCIPYITS
jgi:hypothetical protein